MLNFWYLNGKVSPPKYRRINMALTRKFLQAMGIDVEKIDEIITAHRETVDALKEERDSLKDDAEKLPAVQKELDKAKEQIAEYEEAGGKDRRKVKYDALKEESDKYKQSVEAEKAQQKKSDAYRKLLTETGVSEKRVDAVLRVTDLDGIEFDDEGKLKDHDKLVADIKSEWADFIVKKEEKGAETSTPPGGNGGGDEHTLSRAARVATKHYELIYGKKSEESK
jgi:hypothetical protein